MRFAVSTIALLACTSLASAADLGGPSYGGSLKDDYAAPAYNWTGLYVGAHAGYGWGEHDGTGTYTDNNGSVNLFDGSLDLDGGLVGGQIGANLQTGNLVLGIEADGSWAKIDGSGAFPFDQWGTPDPDYTWNIDTEVEWLASLRGRIGFLVTPTFLVYGTGGVAWAGIETRQAAVCHAPACGPQTVQVTDTSSSETAVGWVAGFGAEWQFGRGWSFKAEWQHYEFDDVDGNLKGKGFASGPTGPVQENYTNDSFPGDVKIDTIRVGVNYKFGN